MRKLQANPIVERVHKTIGTLIRTFRIQQIDIDSGNPWEEILSSSMFTVQSTVHSTTQHTPLQLILGRDKILNINQEVN